MNPRPQMNPRGQMNRRLPKLPLPCLLPRTLLTRALGGLDRLGRITQELNPMSTDHPAKYSPTGLPRQRAHHDRHISARRATNNEPTGKPAGAVPPPQELSLDKR